MGYGYGYGGADQLTTASAGNTSLQLGQRVYTLRRVRPNSHLFPIEKHHALHHLFSH